jgi:D-glycero-alpha-D-manno-heptose-7-phosphate kinase
MRVRATAPCRVDLAGGTLDIWPLGVLQAEALTVNAAIPVWVRLEADMDGEDGEVVHALPSHGARRLSASDGMTDLTAAICFALHPTGGIRVRVVEQAPVGSGIGGSSSYAVALARAVLALEDRRMSDVEIVALTRDLEARVMGTPAGVQDQWAAVLGGVSALRTVPGGVTTESIPVPGDWIADRLSVFYTGITHHSGMVNWQVFRRRIEGEPRTIEALESIAAAAESCRQSLIVGDEAGCAASIANEWAARRRLAPEVCPPELERLTERALDAGASAVKASGAGGGGCLALWHPPGTHDTLKTELEKSAAGGRMLAAGTEVRGCRVEVVNDD